jgi:hypothetical protein
MEPIEERYRDHGGCAAAEPGREGGRRGYCAERPRLHRGLDRHDLGHAQPDGFIAPTSSKYGHVRQ